MNRGNLELICTVSGDGLVNTITPSDPIDQPVGFDLVGCQVIIEHPNFNGQTIEAYLEGSMREVQTPPDPAEPFVDIFEATTGPQAADAVVVLENSTPGNQTLGIGQVAQLRLNAIVAGGGAVIGDGLCTARIVAIGPVSTVNL